MSLSLVYLVHRYDTTRYNFSPLAELAKIQERSDIHVAITKVSPAMAGNAFQPVCGTVLVLDVRLSAFLSCRGCDCSRS